MVICGLSGRYHAGNLFRDDRIPSATVTTLAALFFRCSVGVGGDHGDRLICGGDSLFFSAAVVARSPRMVFVQKMKNNVLGTFFCRVCCHRRFAGMSRTCGRACSKCGQDDVRSRAPGPMKRRVLSRAAQFTIRRYHLASILQGLSAEHQHRDIFSIPVWDSRFESVLSQIIRQCCAVTVSAGLTLIGILIRVLPPRWIRDCVRTRQHE